MKYFYDTEFNESDGKTIDFISIGIVAEDGREFYAVSNEFDTRRVAQNNWLMENVMPFIEHEKFVIADHEGMPLVRDLYVTDKHAFSKERIAWDIHDFIKGDREPELWAWYSAYDHVCLSQLWGKMVDLPRAVPMWTNDIKTLHKQAGFPQMPKQPSGLHNALEDAKMNLTRYRFLEGILKDRSGHV